MNFNSENITYHNYFNHFYFIIYKYIFYSNNSKSLSNSENLDSEIIATNPNGFVWPIPGYTKISSPFGKRTSPTSGASSSHSGIDIPAPPGSNFIAVADGEITFCQFLGAGRLYYYTFF